MGSLLYVRHGLENSPYAHLLDPVGWTEIADVFLRDACALLGLSVDSPLSIVCVLWLSFTFLLLHKLMITYAANHETF